MGKQALTLVDVMATLRRGEPVELGLDSILTPLAREYLQRHEEVPIQTIKPGARVPLICGNWKENKTVAETAAFLKDLTGRLTPAARLKGREVCVCPPFPCLVIAAEILQGSPVRLGAQNMHWETHGAFTGEVSGPMLKEAGCEFVILGHSERRKYFGETDEHVRRKAAAALRAGLTPIVCVGETEKERETGQTFPVLERQMRKGLEGLPAESAVRLVLAYEPVWAIGTGKTATPGQAQEAHRFLRGLLRELFGFPQAQKIRILYGGSITPENFPSILNQEDVDGGLVGGASLKTESFVPLVFYDS